MDLKKWVLFLSTLCKEILDFLRKWAKKVSYSCRPTLSFFLGKVFPEIQKWTFIFVHFSKSQNTLLKRAAVVTIIEFYGLVTKKIIFKMLA